MGTMIFSIKFMKNCQNFKYFLLCVQTWSCDSSVCVFLEKHFFLDFGIWLSAVFRGLCWYLKCKTMLVKWRRKSIITVKSLVYELGMSLFFVCKLSILVEIHLSSPFRWHTSSKANYTENLLRTITALYRSHDWAKMWWKHSCDSPI